MTDDIEEVDTSPEGDEPGEMPTDDDVGEGQEE
jgi:hypothetical protein